MTAAERLAACCAISCFVHFVLLTNSAVPRPQVEQARSVEVVCDLAPPVSRLAFGDTVVLERGGADEEQGTESDLAKARRQYLQAVSDAIHARRFIWFSYRSGAEQPPDCLGTAWISFIISANGRFDEPRLVRSSGDTRLDAAAAEAVRLAGGVVPRPRILGPTPMAVTMPVKYQLAL